MSNHQEKQIIKHYIFAIFAIFHRNPDKSGRSNEIPVPKNDSNYVGGCVFRGLVAPWEFSQ